MPNSSASVSLGDDVNHEALLQTLLAISLTGVLLLRPLYSADETSLVDFAWVQLNPAAQQMLRLPACPAESFLTRFPMAHATGVFAFYRDAFLSGQVERRQNNYQHDGLDGYYLLVAQRQGELLAVSFTDTNEHPRSGVEEELRQSQAREVIAHAEAERQRGELARLFAHAPVAMALFRGPEYVIELANESMATVWSRPLSQVLGQPVFEALPYVRNQGFEALFADVLAQGTPIDLHEVPVTIDRAHTGQPTQGYFNLTYRPQRDAQGHITGIITSAHEVTEQVVARQQVQQLNQELEARVLARTQELSGQQLLLGQILSQVPAAIATLSGPDHRYTFFNDFYQQLSGHRAALGLSVAEVFPEVVEQGFVGLLDNVYRTGEPILGTAMPVQLQNASRGQSQQYYIDFVYQPLFDARQQVVGILAFILEVTDRVVAHQQAEDSQLQVQELNEELAAINGELRATNKELHKSNKQLTRTNTDLDTFVYAASHDLKAPIANIEGLLDALRDYLPTQEQEPMVSRLVGMMEGAITRFQQTVGHLTDISHLQEEAQATETIAVADVLEDVRLDLLPLLESAKAELVMELDTSCPQLRFSTKSLRSVLYNLLSNAVKYRTPGRPPRVQVRTQCTATHLVLTVQDNGLGLDAKQQAQLFAMFRRLHAHVEGSGVGLYLIKRTLENAGGIITVHSEPGVGSTFTVTIPCA